MTIRRDFIALVGGAAAWPFAAEAEKSVMRVVGYLSSSGAAAEAGTVAAIRTASSPVPENP